MNEVSAVAVDHVALAPGRVVGRYEVIEVLGQGGFGITYRALDTQLDREVALKEYLPPALAVRQDGASVLPRSTEVADDFSWGRDRFVSESRTLANLHEAPAIVKVFDFIEANGTAYMVMELVRGETLEQRVKARGPLSPQEADALLWPLLDGLEQVHASGYLHRDIKPGNILLNEEGAPTLIDFGAARLAIAGRSSTMTAIFTPGYAAPEQFTTAKQGPWTDIYGLAATLHHAVTGKAPPNAFDRMLEDTHVPLVRLPPSGFPGAVLAGIDAGLEVRFDARPQSVAAWRALLGGPATDRNATVVMPHPPAASASPTPPTPPTVTPPTPPTTITAAPITHATASALRPRRGVAHMLGLALLMSVLVAGATAYYFLAPPLQPQGSAEPAAARREEATDVRLAEQAEQALKLGVADRQRIQAALGSLGFDTRGADGTFGPRTREMISAWQKAQNLPVTGYLTAAQSATLIRRAPGIVTPAARGGTAAFDGAYGGGLSTSGTFAVPGVVTVEASISGGVLSGRIVYPGCGTAAFTLAVAATGDVGGSGRIYESRDCSMTLFSASGRVVGNRLTLEFRSSASTLSGTLDRR